MTPEILVSSPGSEMQALFLSGLFAVSSRPHVMGMKHLCAPETSVSRN